MAAAQEPRVPSASSLLGAMDLDESPEQHPTSAVEEQRSGDNEPGSSGRPHATGGSLEECLVLLRGKSDEQRLVGLLLATKFVSSGDLAAVEAVFDAVGWAFIGRLFKSGGTSGELLSPYTTLALSLLSAFVRIPKLAAATEMIERVPLLLGIVKTGSPDAGPVQDALECLLGIAGTSEEGLRVELESGGVAAVCHSFTQGKGDEEMFPLQIRLLATLLNAAPKVLGSLAEGELAVPTLAQGFACRTDMLVFECLGCLLGLLRDPDVRTKAARRGNWRHDVRVGVGNLLQSRNVKAEHRLGALKLVHLMVEEGGEEWLVDASGGKGRDNFFLVVMNTLRVETAVQLNEVARALFGSKEGKEKGAFTPGLEEAVSSCYALLEAGVNTLAEVASADTTAVKRTKEEPLPATRLNADVTQKAFGAATEATAVVLDFLEQAKEHGLHLDDTVLASVRVLGRFLAEAPEAHRDKLAPLMGFLLRVKGSDENVQRPDLTGAWCLLPALGQITEEEEGSRMLVKVNGHRAITEFAQDAIKFNLARQDAQSASDMELEEADTTRADPLEAPVARALDVLLNVLDQRAAGAVQISFLDVGTLLPALQSWTRGKPGSPLRLALSAAVISNVLVLTSERALSDEKAFDVQGLLEVLGRFLDESFMSQRSSGADRELWELTLASGAELLTSFPSFRKGVRQSTWMQEVRTMSGGRLSRSTIEHFSGHGSLLNFLAAAAEQEAQGA